AALWLTAGLHRAEVTQPFGLRPETLYSPQRPWVQTPMEYLTGISTGWPWEVGRLPLLPLALTILCALGGLVLLADAVRVQLGLATLGPARLAPWRVLTSAPERRGRMARRVAPGVALIGVAAFLAIGLADRYAGGDPLLQAVALIAVGGWAAALIGSPVLVGALMRIDRDKAGRAREQERQRFAAHLHDSVLQTLALVQRQAHDPAAVVRLARRQEHALRAWMAGEAELASETLAAALREVVAEVEDEYRITIELTAIGDRSLDARGEALVAAAREALRNVARHAPGAPVYVFGEIGAEGAEVFVRDEGPGFDPEAVPSERRGIRDAMVGRMAAVGGRAAIESVPGEGTEVVLALGREEHP
ncbi:MAG: sensor histidine kinase, partial [Solirubrobacteraceae bacterium]